jgi:hypothetical protein
MLPGEESNASHWEGTLFKEGIMEGKTRCFVFSASRRKGHPGRVRYQECCCDDRIHFGD